jgi:hypothetical protein
LEKEKWFEEIGGKSVRSASTLTNDEKYVKTGEVKTGEV